jgi:mannosylglycerate hydrolase
MFLNGFGIKYAVFGRGMPGFNEHLKHFELNWKTDDNSSVIASNHGYAGGLFLAYSNIWSDIFNLPEIDYAQITKQFVEVAKAQHAYAATDNLFFGVGVDHMEPKANLTKIINYINANQEEFELILTTPEEYLKAVGAQNIILPDYKGEMRGQNLQTADLAGTLSSHMALKQINDECEMLLQRVLEPTLTITSKLAGFKYPKGLMDKLWKLLIANHAHDSICGCSIDRVYEDIMTRYHYIKDTGSYILKDAVRTLAGRIDNNIMKDAGACLTVINPLGHKTSKVVKSLACIPKRFDPADYVLVDQNRNEVSAKIKLVVRKNKDLESVYMMNSQLAAIRSKCEIAEKPDDQIFTVLDVEFNAENIPAIGYKTYWFVHKSSLKIGNRRDTDLCVFDHGMENSKLKVVLNTNGTMNITDKTASHTYYGQNYFVDRAETGGLYNHASFETNDIYDSKSCNTCWMLEEKTAYKITYKAKFDWVLPKTSTNTSRSEDKDVIRIVQHATLYSNVDRLEMHIEIENNCENHFLRLAFDTGLKTKFSYAYDHFNVIKRPVAVSQKTWCDVPFEYFVDITDEKRGLGIITKGLPAYEAIENDDGIQLDISLLRAAGYIGYPAGADYPTPKAQCIGKFEFDYAIVVHEGDYRKGCLIDKSADYRSPLVVEGDIIHSGSLPTETSLITISDETAFYNSCLVPSDDGDSIIFRFWNSQEERNISVSSVKEIDYIDLVDFNEKRVDDRRDDTSIKAKAFGITTMKIKFK